ncbi:potassium channel family protein [Streptomyces sp. TR06-5]|uniref:potassium channel family protein n=1 Tax=unclassified Streptomyces TaxID=2593676 RepID=UPI0039A3C477
MTAERPHNGSPERLWALLGLVTAVLVAGYFLLPIDVFGAERPLVSWAAFGVALVAVTVLLLKQMRDVHQEREGVHPGFMIPLLICLTVLVFAAAYFNLAEEPGEFRGIATRLDALYFTVVTLATLGYGDIVPSGQTARLLVLVQLVYNLVFLTAAAAAFSSRFRTLIARRPPSGGRGELSGRARSAESSRRPRPRRRPTIPRRRRRQ